MLSKFFRKKESKPTQAFNNLMPRAKELAASGNTEGLKDLIKIVLRPIQAHHIRDAYLSPDHKGVNELLWSESLGIEGIIPSTNKTLGEYLTSDACFIRDKSKYLTLNLASDITLPTTWHPTSLVCNLGIIGEGLPNGAFKQSTNHSVIYAYPIGIGWVAGGNHSITQAILRGEGEIIPSEFYDLTELIKLIRFDGEQWISIDSGQSLGRPTYPEFGWAWEIGRLLI